MLEEYQDHFALAVSYAKANNDQKWDIAREISLAVEDGYSIREIALAADGSYDKVMTYNNYQNAHIMREIVRRAGSNKLEPLMLLPISYWWTAYTALMKNVDIEYIIDILFESILEENKLKGQRWLKSKLAEFYGGEEDYTQLIKSTRKWITRLSNAMYSMSDSMDMKAATAANKVVDHLAEIEELLNEIEPVEELHG